MLEQITTKISFDAQIAAGVSLPVLMALAFARPALCYGVAFWAYLYMGQIRPYLPISHSASISLLVIASGIGSLLRGRTPWLGSLFFLVISLTALMAGSVGYSSMPIYGRNKVILFAFLVVPIVVVAPMAIARRQELKGALRLVEWSLVVFVLVNLALVITIAEDMEGRIGGIGGISMGAEVLSLACVTFIAKLWMGRCSLAGRIFRMALVAIAMVLVLKTGKRVALLGIGLSLPFLFWFRHRDWLARLLARPALWEALAVLGLVSVAVGPVALRAFLPSMVYEARYASLDAFFGDFSNDRLTNWQNAQSRALSYALAWQSFERHPLTGVGAGGYKSVLEQNAPRHVVLIDDPAAPVYPHNLVLEFAAEQGIFGFIGILLLVVSAAKSSLNIRRRLELWRDDIVLPTICVSTLFLGFMMAMAGPDVPRMMIFWWGVGLSQAAERIARASAARWEDMKATGLKSVVNTLPVEDPQHA